MLKATVYYLNLAVEPFYTKLNAQGWDGPIGKAYSDARYRGNYWKAAVLGILEKAAELDADNAEDVWMKLQNHATAWKDAMDIKVHTTFPRSMDVGDVVVFEDEHGVGMVRIVDTFGFKDMDPAEWTDMLTKAADVHELLEIARAE